MRGKNESCWLCRSLREGFEYPREREQAEGKGDGHDWKERSVGESVRNRDFVEGI